MLGFEDRLLSSINEKSFAMVVLTKNNTAAVPGGELQAIPIR
jgi:hypothetical protein